jgi:phage tail tube protein FII
MSNTEPPNQINFKKLINRYVKLIQSKMSTDDMMFLKKFHPDEYENKMSEFVPEFKNTYYRLFKMIISGTDLSILDLFLNGIDNIETGEKTLNEVRNDLGQVLHDKYN